MRLILKDHNKTAYKRVMAAFEKDRMTCVCHPTGTGKSYIIAAVTEHFKRVLILAPNNFVLRQQSKLINWRRDIEYRTYQWLNKNVTDITERYDLIVLDEFHRAGAPEWSAAVQLLIESQTDAKVLGTSATPIRYLDSERNMADELFNGHVASNMTIAEAWTIYNVLPIPRYVSGLFKWDKIIEDAVDRINRNHNLDEEQKRQRIFRLSNKKLDWEKSYGMPTILRKHLDKDARRVIIFCSHIETLEQMKGEVCVWFREAGFTLSGTYILHSQLKDSEQDQQMRGFEADNDSGVKLMFCVDMLNEGVHVPRVSAVLMLRTTSSRIIYMQQMGRCLTAANTEKPLVLDMVDNITTTTAIKGFQEEFELLEREQAKKEGREPRKFEVIDYTLGVKRLIEKLAPSVWLPIDERLKLVKRFCDEHGHAPRLNKDGQIYVHWVWLCANASENEEVIQLRLKYGKNQVSVEEAIAMIESYHKRSGRFLSFPKETDKEGDRLRGMWRRLRIHYPNHPTVIKWIEKLEKEKEERIPNILKHITELAESGRAFSKTKEYQYLYHNHNDNPDFVAFREKYCKNTIPKSIDECLSIMEEFCKLNNRLPTFVEDGKARSAYDRLKKAAPDHPRLKDLIEQYHYHYRSKRRREEDLNAVEQFYRENGFLPLQKTPLGQRFSRIKKEYPDNPHVQRILRECRYREPRLEYIIEDVRKYCEEHGELPKMSTNESLYKQWKNARQLYPNNPDIIEILNKYGKAENMPRKH